MNPDQISSIDEVISSLTEIISTAEQQNDPNGYFAALYLKVTTKVKAGIADGFFDDGVRMEKLDVIFAKRYLDAYWSYRNNEPVRLSWQKAFELATDSRPIVLQHLLAGMNAHINLDLGIAAAEVSKGRNLAELETDFNKINEILSSLVHDVQDDLSAVWPLLKYILKWTGKVDDYLVDFSMKLARDGAWKFANQFFTVPEIESGKAIHARDQKVAAKIQVITQPGMIASLILKLVRLTERGSVSEKIQKLKT